MSKNKKLLLLGITLVIAGFFIIIFFSSEEEEYVELDLREKNTFEDPENYEFQELEETTLVTNDNLGFSFEVPKDWSVSAYEEDGEEFGYIEDIKGITFLSPDYQANENNEIEKGCEIGVIVFDYENRSEKDYNRLDVLEEEIQEYKNGEEPRYDYIKLVEINNYYGVGYFFDATPSDWQKNKNEGNILIRILVENRIYNIEAIFSSTDAEDCQENFHKLLDSISFTEKMIKKIKTDFILWIIYLISGLFFIWLFLPAFFGLFGEDISPIDDSDLSLKKVIIPDDENIYFDLMELEDLNYSRLISSDVDIDSLLYEDYWDNNIVERTLEENEELLEGIDDMLKKSAYQNPNFSDPENIEINMEINFPSTYFWYDMVKIKALEALYLSKKGNHKEAIEEALKLIEIGDKIQNSQLSSSEYLFTIGIKRIGLDALQKIISSSELSGLEISNYAKKLDAFYDNGYGLESALKIEYYAISRQIDIIASGDKEAIKEYAESMGAGKRTIQKIKSDYFFQPNKTKSYFAGTSRADIATIEQLCGEAEGAEIVEFSIVDPNFGPYTENFIGKVTYEVFSVSLDGMNQGRCEQNLFLRATQAMMGIKAFKNDHGEYPDSLDELVPVYLPSIPIDPFDENPIRYSLEKKIIYSVGRSMEDLGGGSGDNWSKMKNPTFKIDF